MTKQRLKLRLPPLLRSNFIRQLPRRPGPLPVLFALVLFFTILSSFSKRVLGMAIVFDSAMYLHSSVCVLNYIQGLAGFHQPSPEATKLIVEGVLMDGPVLPMLGGLFYFILGLSPSIKNMGAALLLQALLQATAAVLVYKVTFDLTKKKILSQIAGYCWGFYPAAILGAGKFMTEILSTCLILLLVLSLTRIRKPRFAFAAGILLGLLALTKAALAPAAALAVVFGMAYLVLNKVSHVKIDAAIAATIFGVVLTLGPWVAFTHQITGKMLLTTNRQPTHNLVSGVNPENDGWASLPDTPLGALFTEEDPALPSATGIVLPNSGYEMLLVTRKIVRLFAQPWNDYRLNCLLMPLPCQIAWHKLLLALGLFGMVALLMDIARKQIERVKEIHDTRMELIFCLLTVLLLGHFIYLPFVACSRYGFTAMPILTIFATLGLSRVFGLGAKALLAALGISFTIFAFEFNVIKVLESQVLNNHNFDVMLWGTAFKVFLCLVGILSQVRLLRRSTGFKFLPWSINVFLAVMVFLLLTTAAVDTYFEPMNGELVFKFTNTRPMLRTCYLGESELKDPNLKTAYLLLDSRTKTTILGKMTVNGKATGLFLAPFYLIHPEQNLEGCYEMFSKLRFQRAAELNQWYLAEIPLSMLKAGKNEISITPEIDYVLSVNGTPKSRYLQGNYVSLPSLTYFSPTLLMNDLNGFDARPRQTIYIATGKGRRIECSLDRNLDGDYERTNLNTLVLLVYERTSGATPGAGGGASAAAAAPSTPVFPKPLDLYRYFVAPH